MLCALIFIPLNRQDLQFNDDFERQNGRFIYSPEFLPEICGVEIAGLYVNNTLLTRLSIMNQYRRWVKLSKLNRTVCMCPLFKNRLHRFLGNKTLEDLDMVANVRIRQLASFIQSSMCSRCVKYSIFIN